MEQSNTNICYDYEPYSKEDLLERFKLLAAHNFQRLINKYLISADDDRKIEDLSRDELENIYEKIIEDIKKENKEYKNTIKSLTELMKNHYC